MATPLIPRSLAPVIRAAARDFPAVVLLGPRQSGKTTLLRHLFARTHRFVSLEAMDTRAAAVADPRGLLAQHPPPVIFDEIQHAPELLSYIKEQIDTHRQRRGHFVFTGSQNLALQQHVAESLAGRAATFQLLPLARREIDGAAAATLPWERRAPRSVKTKQPLWPALLRGSYPELWRARSRPSGLWHASYLQTYLERDVRALRQVGDLTQFQSFLRVLAARSGQLLNLSDVGRDLGVAANTCKQWLSVLEATFQVVILRPFARNVGKRLIKAPKVYFTDTGTLCALVGLSDAAHAAAGPMAGAIFETAVITEVFKAYRYRGELPALSFWRTAAGQEVDLVVEAQGRCIPVEIKLTATPRPAMARHVRDFLDSYAGSASAEGFVVHGGDVALPIAPGVRSVPFARL